MNSFVIINKKKIGIVLFVLIMSLPYRLWFSFGPFQTISILDIILWLIAGSLIVKGQIYIGNRNLFFALILPFLLATLSLTWSNDKLSTFKMVFYSLTAVVGYLGALNISNGLSTSKIEKNLMFFNIIAISIAVMYFMGVPLVRNFFGDIKQFQFLSDKELFARYARLNSPFFGLSNDFASIISLYVLFFIGIALVKRKSIYIIWAIIVLLGVILSFSRGVIAALLLVGFFIINKFKTRDLLLAVTGLSLITLLVYLVGISQQQQYDQNIIVVRIAQGLDLDGRMEIWEDGLGKIMRNPILGLGGGSYMIKDTFAYHNTYLEQFAAYGIFFGSIANLFILSLPFYFLFWKSNFKQVNLAAQFIGLSIMVYNIFCIVETSNEATMPKLYLYMFIGFSVTYLHSLQKEIENQQSRIDNLKFHEV